VTDNGSNFVKAFKEYGSEYFNVEADDNEEECEEADFVNIQNLLEEEDSVGSLYKLPPHQRCASHTLSLICTIDANQKSSKIMKSAFGKCQGLWNKCSRSTKCAETAKEVCGTTLKKPCVTRWNSMYDCLRDILKNKENLPKVCIALGIPILTEVDLEFITNYCFVVQPIAEALDRLQGENATFYGELLPTLLTVQKKLVNLQDMKPRHCEWLPEILLHGLKRRFANELEISTLVQDAVIASVSHPKMKLRWVPAFKIEEVRKSFINTVILEAQANRTGTFDASLKPAELKRDAIKDDFLIFEDAQVEVSAESDDSEIINIKQECINYLSDASIEIGILDKYKNVKHVFIKYNTPLPSSGPVERLFSYSNMILTPKRMSLSDGNFETLLLLKTNGY